MKDFFRNEISNWKKNEVLWLLFSSLIIVSLSIYFGENIIGIISALTGVICVVMTGKGKISAYIFGLINAILYTIIAFSSGFYGDVMLRVVYYIPMQFIGFYLWKKNINNVTYEVKKEKLSIKNRFNYIIFSILAILIYGFLLSKLGGNLPYVDSASTCLAILAMIFSVKRLAEQWYLWIIINSISIVMWAVSFINNQENIATLLMWIIYLTNSIIMLIKWLKESKGE